MKNPIEVTRHKYLNGRASYVAKLGQVEAQADTKEAAEALLLREIDALAIKSVAVRVLNDGRVAVLQCFGADPSGLRIMYTYYDASGVSGGSCMFNARHWREAVERFESELRACGHLVETAA